MDVITRFRRKRAEFLISGREVTEVMPAQLSDAERKARWQKSFAVLNRRWPYRDPEIIGNFSPEESDFILQKQSPALKKQNGEKTVPVVSLIVPLFNAERFLPCLLPSVFGQTTQYSYEVLLINDGSTDETLKRVQGYANMHQTRNAVILSEANRGIGAARNLGIRNAQGIYLCFLDQDDRIEPDFIEKMAGIALQRHADVVKCAFSENSADIVLKTSPCKPLDVSGPLQSELDDTVGYVWGALYDRSLFRHVRFPEGYWYEDMIRELLLYRQSRHYIQLPEVLYHKEIHNSNASGTVWRSRKGKCIENLYLIWSITNAYHGLELPEDAWFYRSLLRECSSRMAGRLSGEPAYVRKAAFTCCSLLCSKYYRKSYEEILNDRERIWNNAILDCDFSLYSALFVTGR